MDREARGVGEAPSRDEDGRGPTGSGRETPDVETASDGYANRFSGAVGAWFLEQQAAITLELLDGLPRGASILDVGGGHAQLTGPLVDAGFAVTVLGSAPDAGRRLTPWLERGEASFETGDLTDLPYDDRAFDAALSFRLLPHLHAWERLIPELCRVSRRRVVFDYPSVRSVNLFADRMFAFKKRVEENTRPYTLFHPSRIAAYTTAAGFSMRDARPQFFWPMVLHRVLGSSRLSRALEAPPRILGLTRIWGSPVIVRADRDPSA